MLITFTYLPINSEFYFYNNILIFFISFISNTFSAISGGGAGLIQLPALMLFGFPYYQALATHKVATVALGFGGSIRNFKYLRNNIGTPAVHGFIPPGLPSFNSDIIGYNYNPIKAKELLADTDFNIDEEIKLFTTSSYLDLCEYIQNSLQDIGLNIKIEVNPPSTHRQMVATSRLPFFRGSWIADYPDAENYLALFYSKNFRGPAKTPASLLEYVLSFLLCPLSITL